VEGILPGDNREQEKKAQELRESSGRVQIGGRVELRSWGGGEEPF